MISAMPAVAVRRERKKQRAAAHSNNGSRRGSLSSLPSPSTRSSSLLSSSPSPMSVPGNYYNYFARHQQRRPSSASAASTPGAVHPPLPCGAPSRRPSASGVSTISSAASNYVSALHKVRERQLDLYRERARFLVYTGSVLLASGATLVIIGLVAAATAAQTVGLLFMCLGLGLCLARVFCLVRREELPLVRRARTVSGQSIYVPSTAHQSAATTPGTDDSSTTSSYYFSAVPLQRIPLSPSTETVAPPPPRPPPPPPPVVVVVPGVHGAVGSHRSNPSSLLTPMSLDSIPEMQVLITDDSQRKGHTLPTLPVVVLDSSANWCSPSGTNKDRKPSVSLASIATLLVAVQLT